MEGLDGRELAARLGDVERTIRKLEAVAASIVATADRREVFGEDGHVSVRGWVKASIRVSDHTVTRRVRTANLCDALPLCRDRLAGGSLGVDQVGELARVFANPRCGPQLATVVDSLMEVAETAPFEVFARSSAASQRPTRNLDTFDPERKQQYEAVTGEFRWRTMRSITG